METFEYCKESYLHELSRRNDLRSALNLPIGLAVVLAGALYSLLNSFSWSSCIGIIGYSFGFSSALSGIALGLVIFYLIRSHVNYEYAYVPTPKEILEYREKLLEHYRDTKEDLEGIEKEAEHNTMIYLEKEFARNAHHNALNNNEKSGYLHTASIFLVGSLIFTMLAGILVIISNWAG